ncbi:MAG TPA: peptidoglycan bridge formation glycyltransferase FemA/FemB family protein [Candidatus Binatia bacterium]|nr:peptidoglycan bridge formation glycyltransferase FemA/FemB family protein [Candidatus Binatia bacterium]
MPTADYSLSVSEEFEDNAWDAFLEKMPGGDHLQTSLWAQVKASVGWRPIRLVVRCEELIVAGAQILVRDTPIVGAIGYVVKGPVFAYEDPDLVALLTAKLQEIARSYSIQQLSVQPPLAYGPLLPTLKDRGFSPSPFKLAPPATTRLDLSRSEDELLAGMNSRTRYNVRRSSRKGIIVRTGSDEDLQAYYRLVEATTERKQFAGFPRRYYDAMWRILAPRGYMKLLVAEYEGEIVSELMLITFGDTALNKLGVWSGKHGDKRPNDAIHWAAATLAKSLGHRYYDLGGIAESAAEAILQGEPLPESAVQTVTSFKLDFGGEVLLFPFASDYHAKPLYRWAFTEVYPWLHKHKSVRRAFNWLRTRRTLLKR